MSSVFGTDTNEGIYQLNEHGGRAIVISTGKLKLSGSSLQKAGSKMQIYASMRDEKGKILYEKTHCLNITNDCVIDTLKMFVIEDALGFKSAICAAFGEGSVETRQP